VTILGALAEARSRTLLRLYLVSPYMGPDFAQIIMVPYYLSGLPSFNACDVERNGATRSRQAITREKTQVTPMNRPPLGRLPRSFLAGLIITFSHVLGLAVVGLVGAVTWVRIIAPLFGFDDRVVQVNVWTIAAIILGYAGFLIVRNRANRAL